MQDLWAIVLAGGEGTRLQPLTRALYGEALPKQFAVLVGDRSLLQLTIERAARSTSYDRILVVATAERAAIARQQLAPYPGVELVLQPRALDTAPGLLLPLARVLARDPFARIAVLPSDHYVVDARPLVAALQTRLADRIALVGVEATSPEIEYGWIVPGESLDGSARRVISFVEKPDVALARRLQATHALWNTFMQCGPLQTYWELARRHLPLHAAALERYSAAIGTPGERAALELAYEHMAPANFSSEILARASEHLAVLPVAGSGWSDWGSPQRVFESLAGSVQLDELIARIRVGGRPHYASNHNTAVAMDAFGSGASSSP